MPTQVEDNDKISSGLRYGVALMRSIILGSLVRKE
jgi:hypothetical protein